ncbi:helix-turn-helix domain-containing protein [Nesterenkonia muleiensis]|uniref:helix-turn-helix domain-containing protein n=1 Tax=Nesterenkonia muleiensis TaxID=2282648 RepID=UPI000E72DF15|nr:GAF domain-containing protein [Nesterenkonia muleiensis]
MHEQWLTLVESLVQGDHQAVHEATSALVESDASDRTHHLLRTLQTKWEALRAQATDRQLLYDTVTELSKLDDPEDVLRFICEQVRRTFSCEVSYISIFDDVSGISYTRTSVGDAEVQFSAVQFSHGMGVGGKVMATGRPYATADYWRDKNIQHDPSVDEVVRREGFVTIAAAPMIVDGDILGVLFVASRSLRIFTQKELAILGALSMHAGPAFARALSKEKLSRAHDHLAEVTDTLQEERARAKYISEIHRELSVLVLDGAGVEEISQRLGTILSAMVKVVDSESDCSDESAVFIPIGAGGQQIASLMVCRDEPLHPWEHELCERGALVLAWSRVRDEAQAASHEQVRGELLEDVMLRRALRSFPERVKRVGAGCLAEGAIALVILPLMVQQRNPYRLKVMRNIRSHHGLMLDRGDRVIVLLPSWTSDETLDTIATEFFQEGGRGYAGKAGPGSSFLHYSHLIEEATVYATAARSLNINGRIVDNRSFGLIGLHLGSGEKDPHRIIESEIGGIIRYDSEHRTDLVRTLKAYFDSDMHIKRTAEELIIHPKTVTQRLQRVDSIIGEGWSRMPRALQVGSAIYLYEISQTLAESSRAVGKTTNP